MRSVDRTSEYCVEPCMMWQPRTAVELLPEPGGLTSWKSPVQMDLSPDIEAMTQNVEGAIPKRIKLTLPDDKKDFSIEVARWRRPCLYSSQSGESWYPITCFQDLPHAYIGLPHNTVTLQLDADEPLELESDGNIPALSFIESGDGEVLWSTTDYARFVSQSTKGVEIDAAIWGTSRVVEPLAVHTEHGAIVVTMPHSIDHLSDKDNGTLRGGVLSFAKIPNDCDDATGFCGQSASGRHSSIASANRPLSVPHGQFVGPTQAVESVTARVAPTDKGTGGGANGNGGGANGNGGGANGHGGGANGHGGGANDDDDDSTSIWRTAAIIALITKAV